MSEPRKIVDTEHSRLIIFEIGPTLAAAIIVAAVFIGLGLMNA